jgi:hypothetical protein
MYETQSFNEFKRLSAEILERMARTNDPVLAPQAFAALSWQTKLKQGASTGQPPQKTTSVRDQVEQQANQLKTMQQRGQAGLGSLTQQASLQPAPAQGRAVLELRQRRYRIFLGGRRHG